MNKFEERNVIFEKAHAIETIKVWRCIILKFVVLSPFNKTLPVP